MMISVSIPRPSGLIPLRLGQPHLTMSVLNPASVLLETRLKECCPAYYPDLL